MRRHWGIENGLHWVLDIVFGEDQSRARADNAQAYLVTVRHLARNPLPRPTVLLSNVGTWTGIDPYTWIRPGMNLKGSAAS